MSKVIYKIRNITNDKFYVGSTQNRKVRFNTHRRQLRAGNHHCRILQQAWDKYGEEFFKFEIVEHVDDDASVFDVEQKWLDEHHGAVYCYNSSNSAVEPPHLSGENHPLHGKECSPETRAKISAGVRKADSEGRGKRHHEVTAETRARMSDALKGNECAKGYKRTDAEKEAISQRTLGNQNFLGKHHTDESRAKMGKALIEVTTGKEFAVMNDAVKFYGMPNLTQIYRQMKSGKPVTRGKFKGMMWAYSGDELPVPPAKPDVPDEYVSLPRTRGEAMATGAKQYFTGIPCKRGHISPRATKGTCIACRREDDKAKPKQPRTDAQKAAGRKYYEKNREAVIARASNKH